MRFCISILDIPVVRGVYNPIEPECGNHISRADHTLIIKCMMKGFPRSAALQKGDEQNLNCSHLHLQRASNANIFLRRCAMWVDVRTHVRQAIRVYSQSIRSKSCSTIWWLGVLFIEMIKNSICPFAIPCVIAFTPAPLEDDVRPINCKYIELPSPVTLIRLSLKVDATIISGCDPQIMCASYVSPGNIAYDLHAHSHILVHDTIIYRHRIHENENVSKFARLIVPLIISH